MKAPSSDSSVDDGAEDFQLDYEEFFSVLMYYGHMSKSDIMNSSRPFLYGIYKQYGKRACENLGVSFNDKDEDPSSSALKESDYPKEFKKLSAKDRDAFASKFESDEDFFSGFSDFKRNKFTNDKTFGDRREIEV